MMDFYASAVVCNTGPIIALTFAGMGHLFVQIFPKILTTEAVWAELTAKASPESEQIRSVLRQFEIVATTPPDPFLTTELDLGEALVIQAARDKGLSSVILDERRARRIAAQVYGLQVRGTCGLLLEAKRRKLLDEVLPMLSQMRQNGYFLGPNLVAECLKHAGE